LNVLQKKKEKKRSISITFPDLYLSNDGNSIQRYRAASGRSIRRVQLVINSIASTQIETAHGINNQLCSKLTIFRIALQPEPGKLGTLIRRAPLDERELPESSTIWCGYRVIVDFVRRGGGERRRGAGGGGEREEGALGEVELGCGVGGGGGAEGAW
jgi:hypothetical protein